MDRPNLPHQPFPRVPVVWGAPPVGRQLGDDSLLANPSNPAEVALSRNGISDLASAIASVTFSFRYTTGTITAAFPTATRVANQGFVTPVGIISVELSTAFSNAASDGVAGVFVAKDVGPTIDFSANTNLYVAHLCPELSTTAFRSGMTFADDVAPKFGSGERMALYICAAGTGSASDLITAVVNVRYFSATI